MEKQRENRNKSSQASNKSPFHQKDPPNLTLKLNEVVKWPIDYMKLVRIYSQLWPSIDTCPVKKSFLFILNSLHAKHNLTGDQDIMMREMSHQIMTQSLGIWAKR